MSGDRPIGIFDSGVGGLSVAREIRRRLRSERIVYFADTAHCPYGGRPLEEIRSLSVAAGAALVRNGAKIIVVACNTASGAALETLRARLDVPIVGLEPAVKPAAEATRTGRIGVMATAATLRTERFDRLTHEFASDVDVIAQACPGLVELVEEGRLAGDEVDRALEPLLEPLRDAHVDAVVLGCTHYPFLREAIARGLGPEVRIIDSGAAVAKQVETVLRAEGLLRAQGADPGRLRLLTTGDPREVARVAEHLWGAPVDPAPIEISPAASS